MPRKKVRPDSNGKLKRRKGKVEDYVFVRVPTTLKHAIQEAAKHESIVRGHVISVNEWMTRAAIDRVGEIFGAPTAKQFYRQFFNGFAAIHTDVVLPEPLTTTSTGTDGDANN